MEKLRLCAARGRDSYYHPGITFGLCSKQMTQYTGQYLAGFSLFKTIWISK